jgi:hypothetical protein
MYYNTVTAKNISSLNSHWKETEVCKATLVSLIIQTLKDWDDLEALTQQVIQDKVSIYFRNQKGYISEAWMCVQMCVHISQR